MKYLIVPLILTLASCSNPADSTVDAKVAEPTEPAETGTPDAFGATAANERAVASGGRFREAAFAATRSL